MWQLQALTHRVFLPFPESYSQVLHSTVVGMVTMGTCRAGRRAHMHIINTGWSYLLQLVPSAVSAFYNRMVKCTSILAP